MVAEGGGTFHTDWIPMDSQFQNGLIHTHCQTLAGTVGGNGFEVEVETSYDTVETNQIGSTINVNATGSQNAAISANIASMVRLKITNSESGTLQGILSVWLQPKSD